jgi:hypothetical protein
VNLDKSEKGVVEQSGIYIFMYIYICVFIYIHIYMYISICKHTYIYICIYGVAVNLDKSERGVVEQSGIYHVFLCVLIFYLYIYRVVMIFILNTTTLYCYLKDVSDY